MLELLIKKFIKNSDDISDTGVRTAYGKLCGIMGIICNIVLFVSKLLAGTLSGSVSITADAVNNLSDAGSSAISLIGFKMSEKPADEGHPYGHARYEYLSGLTVAVMIIVIGFELFKSSFIKVLHPEQVDFSPITAIVLVGSILLKSGMMSFNRKIGKKINSATLEAAAADSRNDVITTGAVFIASVASKAFEVNLDGYMGVAVAIFILYSGFGLVKDTLDPLLGKAPDPEFVDYIKNKILSYDGVLGTHDLMIHDYGPGRQFASVHVEMAAEDDVLKNHDIIDNIERDFLENDNLNLIIHFDPIITRDEHTNDLREWLMKQVKTIDEGLSIHDLRIIPGTTHTNLVFDCLIPVGFGMNRSELKAKISELVKKKYPNYYCIMTIDTNFAAMPHTK